MSDIAGRLAELKARFLRGADERVAALSRLLEDASARPGDAEARRELQRGFHSLAGLAGTHGLHEVTRISRDVELRCEDWSEPSSEDFAFVEDAIACLREEVRNASNGSRASGREQEGRSEPTNILVLAGDHLLARKLETELLEEGFVVRTASTTDDASELIEKHTPDGVIVEPSLAEGSGLEIIERLRASVETSAAPAIVIGTDGDFVQKVAALRSGADLYLEPGCEPHDVARKMRDLLDTRVTAGARILSVEDDPEQAEFIKTVLESAGYEVRVCPDPSRFAQDLANFRPDLILMDIVLPKISGYDLARVVRHEPAHATLPILFLTSETHARLETIRAGGDDHLIKPIAPKLLLTVVAQRLRRSRSVQVLIDADGLTGLLTRSAFLQRAEEVVARQSPFNRSSAALVMLDIDHFKSVNDTRGHAAGDQVLAALGRLLRRRVRAGDILGRCGGEEFAILFPDISEENAEKLVSRILREFSSMPHRLPDGSVFRVSFSAGVSMLKAGMDLETWKKAADDSLYDAKHAGRNRIRIA
jgi:diguanylate cyclase (GGDEF)-like protein